MSLVSRSLTSFKRVAIFAAVLILAGPSVFAQSAPPAPASGHVIFSRSTDANGKTTTQVGDTTALSQAKIAEAPTASDVERAAVTFTGFNMDVHLNAAAQRIAVRALMTVRNDGKAPLAHLPLQISSTLNWERIRLDSKDAPFQVAVLNSDSDHTGQLHEATVPLAQPLAPGASVELDVSYSGSIAVSAQRLLAIGTPEDAAVHSDWDGIGVDFTGLRGFGNVVWYPVSAVPVMLGDGARLFDEIGEHKLRLTGAHFRLRLTAEFPHGQAPTVALINGHSVPLAVTDKIAAGDEVPGVATADSGTSRLGFEAPSLFLAIRNSHEAANTTIWTLPENDGNIDAWTTAATAVTPFLQGWLGEHPRAQLALLDLPDGQDAPFEGGAMLATSIHSASPDRLNGVLVHALTHAWMQSPRAWLSEGVAQFMGTLWVEKKVGRTQALGTLEAGRSALALAEPESPGQSSGQPLAQAVSPVYFRTKATYILWMLRDVAGDDALSAAFRAYDPAADLGSLTNPAQKAAVPGVFEKLLEQAGAHRNLSAFFGDWVDADKGLPDLSIDGAFPTIASAGNWLLSVNVTNNGYAAANVPVTVRSDSASVTERMQVPAHGKAVQRILIQGKPTEVQVNDGTVPETQASVHATRLDEGADADSPASAVPESQAAPPKK